MTQDEVYSVIKKHNDWITSKEISKKLNHISRNSVSASLRRLRRFGLLKLISRTTIRGNGKEYLYKIR